MIKREEHLRSLQCKTSDGQEHIVDVYEEVLDAATFEEPSAEVRGLTIFRTRGNLVIPLGKGCYRIAATGEILTSEDPNAP